MDDAKMFKEILNNTKFWIALVGFLGVLAGSLISTVGNFVIEWWKRWPNKKLNDKRKDLLKKMLEDDKWPNKWRYLNTLSAVIGADNNETKRLLIEIEARGSEKDDGLWGLIKYHPLTETNQ